MSAPPDQAAITLPSLPVRTIGSLHPVSDASDAEFQVPDESRAYPTPVLPPHHAAMAVPSGATVTVGELVAWGAASNRTGPVQVPDSNRFAQMCITAEVICSQTTTTTPEALASASTLTTEPV